MGVVSHISFKEVPRSIRPQSGEGVLIRGVARIIDYALIVVVTFINVILIEVAFGIVTGLMSQPPSAAVGMTTIERVSASLERSSLLGWLLGTASMIVGQGVFEGLYGSSPGKLILGMVILKDDGTVCDLKAGLIREAGFLIDMLFFGIVGIGSIVSSPRRQRRGDVMARTFVVKRKTLPPEQFQPDVSVLATICTSWLTVLAFDLLQVFVGLPS